MPEIMATFAIASDLLGSNGTAYRTEVKPFATKCLSSARVDTITGLDRSPRTYKSATGTHLWVLRCGRNAQPACLHSLSNASQFFRHLSEMTTNEGDVKAASVTMAAIGTAYDRANSRRKHP